MNETKKWIAHRISAIILAPLYVWLFFSLILLVSGFFHVKIGLSEIFEDYIQDAKIKNVANLLTFLLSIIIPSITIILLLYKF